jgi:hypothetical protein
VAAGKAREEVGEVHLVERRAAGAEVRGPLRRRTKLLVRAVRAELVVGGALLAVLQRRVRLADLLEAGLGVLLLRDVG